VTLVAAPAVDEALATWTLTWDLGTVVVGPWGLVVVVVLEFELDPPMPVGKVPCVRNRIAATTKAAVTAAARGRFRWPTSGPRLPEPLLEASLTSLDASGPDPGETGP